MGQAEYSTDVAYTTSYKEGIEEGFVAVYESNGGISDEIAIAVMRKVMINPALAPGPNDFTDPASWNTFILAPLGSMLPTASPLPISWDGALGARTDENAHVCDEGQSDSPARCLTGSCT